MEYVSYTIRLYDEMIVPMNINTKFMKYIDYIK